MYEGVCCLRLLAACDGSLGKARAALLFPAFLVRVQIEKRIPREKGYIPMLYGTIQHNT